MKSPKLITTMLFAVTIALLPMCNGTSPYFLLAFVEKNTNVLHVRTSYDGRSWKSANLPNIEAVDVGAGAMANGLVDLLIWRERYIPNWLDEAVGLPNSFDLLDHSSVRTYSTSAPSVVHLKDNKWLVAHRSYSEGMMFARVYNSADDSYDESADPISVSYYASTHGRPALVRKENEVVCSWLEGNDATGYKWQILRGGVTQEGSVVWQNGYTWQQRDTDGRYYSIRKSQQPALASDGSKYYYAAVLTVEPTPLGIVSRHLYLLGSPTASEHTWELEAEAPSTFRNSLDASAYVNIAALGPGNILVVAVGQYHYDACLW